MQKMGSGTDNMASGDQTSTHLYFLSELRKRMPNKIITYTFPADDDGVDNFPFRDVLKYGHQYVNTINAYRASEESIIKMIEEYNVPRSKVSVHPCCAVLFKNVRNYSRLFGVSTLDVIMSQDHLLILNKLLVSQTKPKI